MVRGTISCAPEAPGEAQLRAICYIEWESSTLSAREDSWRLFCMLHFFISTSPRKSPPSFPPFPLLYLSSIAHNIRMISVPGHNLSLSFQTFYILLILGKSQSVWGL